MIMTLQCKKSISLHGLPQFNSDLDNIVSLLSYVCEYMEDVECCEFTVSGFGQEKWPVDIHTDLLTFLIQLPISLKSIENNTFFEIDFYEQGLERNLIFKPLKNSWEIQCISRTNWNPNPHFVILDSGLLNNMLTSFLYTFLAFIDPIRCNNSKGWCHVIEEWKTGSWIP